MQVATLFRESTSLLGSSAGMEAATAVETTATTITSTGSSSSIASPGPAVAMASTTPAAALSTLPTTPLMSATTTPPPSSSSSSSPPLATASSPTASSSSSSVSSSSSSSASSASPCTPPNSNATTTSTPSSAPAPLTVTPPPTTEPIMASEHEQPQLQQHIQQQQQQQQKQSPPLLSPRTQQEQPQLIVETGGCGACHPQDACHDVAVPLDLCPSSLNVGYDFSTNNPNNPANYSNKYKLNMKLEREDDGYETANSLPPRGGTADGGGNSSGGGEIKCEKLDDPYSFIDDDPMPIMNNNGSGVMQPHPIHHMQQQQQQQQHQPPGPLPHHQQQHQMPGMDDDGGMGATGPDGGGMLGAGGPPPYAIDSGMPYHYHMAIGPKKRGRKKKIKSDEPEFTTDPNGSTIPRPPKERKKHDRFNGMPEEEVSKRTLPDHITANLDIIIIGINPGLFAAYKGHHYAGPGNHFWKCLYLSGLTPQQMSADEDYKLLQVGIGFTNMVARATKGSADLTRKEIKDGSQILLEKIKKFQPKIAVFNGKLIYEVFSGKKDFNFGRQPDLVEGTNTYMWVMPSSSARCAQLPRAADKVPFYAALKKFRDYLNGLVASIDDAELVFTEPRVKSCYEAEPRGDPLLFGSETLTEVGDDNAIINRDEDGSVVNPAAVAAAGALLPNKKKRGRPKKVKVEGNGEDGAVPVVKVASQPRRNNNSNASNANSNCDFPKKKRGRPKKVKVALADDESDMSAMNANLLRNSGDLNSGNNHGMHLGMAGPLSGHHPMLHSGALTGLDNGSNNNHLSSAKCFSSPSPIQSPPPHHFYHHQQQQHHHPHQQQQHPHQQQQQQQQLYGGYCLSPRPQSHPHPHTPVLYHTTPNHNSSNSSQSPRPQSQPFTHSDLSSEISAAISSSEQLGSPPPSPGMLGAPDFEPPTSMAEEDGGSSRSVHGGDGGGGGGTGGSTGATAPGSGSSAECCRLSPATTPNSVAVEQQQHYTGYHSAYGHHHHQQQQQQQQQFHVGAGMEHIAGMEHPGPASSVGVVPVPPPPAPSTPEHHQQQSPQPQVAHQQQQQDIAAKSLSGLESLVDQIPSITDGEAAVLSEPTDYSTHQFGHQYRAGSPVGDMGVGAAALYGYGSTGGAAASYHHVPHQHLPAALYATPSWAAAGSAYDSPHVPLPYQPGVYGHHGPPPVGVGVPPPPPHHHQAAYGAPGSAGGIHVPSPNYPSPYYGYPPQTHHHHGYHHHHHHPSYLGGF